jgi:hypothetical protein
MVVLSGMIRRDEALLKLHEWLSGGATILCRAALPGIAFEMESVIGRLEDEELVLVSGGSHLSLRLNLPGEEFLLTAWEDSPLPSEGTGSSLVILFPVRGVTRDSVTLVVKE